MSALVSIAPRPRAEPDLVETLLECHKRMRHFIRLAIDLGEANGLAAVDAAESAGMIHRYFTLAMPQHEQDEEQSLAPRLAGRSPELDEALRRMLIEHRQIDEHLRRLIEVCGQLRDDPSRWPVLKPELRLVAWAVGAAIPEHLAIEEQVIFPAAAALPDVLQKLIRNEMRERRKR